MTVAGISLRGVALADIPAIAAFRREVQDHYGSGGTTDEEALEHELTSGLIDREHNACIAFAGDRIVGDATIWDQTRAGERLFLDVRVHPRERLVYSRFLDWAERRAGELAAETSGVLRARTASDDETFRDELTARGYRLIRHFFRMEIDLAEEPPPPGWPAGIKVRTFRAGDERPVFDAISEAFADHWDWVPISYEDYLRFGPESPTFDPELVFIAEDKATIAGVALCELERSRDSGHVAILGVRRPWRRRGLGLALLRRAFAEFRLRGRPQADLGVDAASTTGAVRLYERAGMRVARRSDHYELPIGRS